LSTFEIVAHRGVPLEQPENTLSSFQRAVELGADAVELDVRLTRDLVPVVYHYFYLVNASVSGPIFNYTFEQLKSVELLDANATLTGCKIPLLSEVLQVLGKQIKLEIEIKGPEPESVNRVVKVLHDFKSIWDRLEITSYEIVLLREIQERCAGLATDLLFPPSEPWMGLDVVGYSALHHARLARARAIHLHPSQLSPEIVSTLRSADIGVHCWDVNDEQALQIVTELEIPRICTDRLQQAIDFRRRIAGDNR
jgi:glycerophosphoryl diester phosphodiesterase